MVGVKYLIAITKREFAQDYLDFFKRYGAKNVISNFGNGTATESTLNLLGLEKTEKVIFKTIVNEEKVPSIMKGLLSEMDISSAGNGLAVFMPVDSFAGKNSLNYFVNDYVSNKKGGNMNSNESKIVMIISIIDKGNTEILMNTAREAGANGGTVVRGKGTGADIAKFFGVSISEEKELVYILARRENRDAIMKAIMEKTGVNKNFHPVTFSIPVDCVVGLSAFDNII